MSPFLERSRKTGYHDDFNAILCILASDSQMSTTVWSFVGTGPFLKSSAITGSVDMIQGNPNMLCYFP